MSYLYRKSGRSEQVSNDAYLGYFLSTKTQNTARNFTRCINDENIQFVETIREDVEKVAIAFFQRLVDRLVDTFKSCGRKNEFVPFSSYSQKALDYFDTKNKTRHSTLSASRRYFKDFSVDVDDYEEISYSKNYSTDVIESSKSFISGYQNKYHTPSSMYYIDEGSGSRGSRFVVDDDEHGSAGDRRRSRRDDRVSSNNDAYSLGSTLKSYFNSAYNNVCDWFSSDSSHDELADCFLDKQTQDLILKSSGVEKVQVLAALIQSYLKINSDTVLIIANSVRQNDKLRSVLKADIEESYKKVFSSDKKLWALVESMIDPAFSTLVQKIFLSEEHLASTTNFMEIIRRQVISAREFKFIIHAVKVVLALTDGEFANSLATTAAEHYINLNKNARAEVNSDDSEVYTFLTQTIDDFRESAQHFSSDFSRSANNALNRLRLINSSELGYYLGQS